MQISELVLVKAVNCKELTIDKILLCVTIAASKYTNPLVQYIIIGQYYVHLSIVQYILCIIMYLAIRMKLEVRFPLYRFLNTFYKEKKSQD